MTQEFLIKVLNMKRQAVSKWGRGESDPSQSDLIARQSYMESLLEIP